jgi:hypothetical protein
MEKKRSNQELYSQNIIAAKIVNEKRNFYGIGNVVIVKDIERTKYLKICWHCGEPYESNKSSSFACRGRCSQNINRRRKQGLNPVARMSELTKPKNTKQIKEQFGYR